MNDYEWRRLEQAIYRGTHPLSNPLELTLGIVAVALFIAAMGFVRHYGDWIMVHLFTLVIVIAVSLPVLAIIAFSFWFIFFTFIGRLMFQTDLALHLKEEARLATGFFLARIRPVRA